MKRYTDSERRQFALDARCYDCGRSYLDSRWIETSVPDDVWEAINPTEHEGCGLLCIQCIANRCVEAGLEDVPVRLVAGPLKSEGI